ncbi:bifunctional DedA family/phosphatase PAP2 family protein [Marinobacter caseinilyticus]|uniref:bifunctional DedA family/phosphatase PAP2 family protein n=1 Tax=Marinobacter caseinilyticus TaxID=2692195 RepID=UPI00140DF850|nr:bifunctional DedA family/phosphatase PAP2 family protein [Marinobacter caseinilyticus]
MISDWLETLTAWLAGHPGWLAAALLLTALTESLAIAGLIVPGVAILFAMAALAGKTGMPVVEALVWAGAGAVLGDGISFWLGRHFKGRLHTLWPLSRYQGLLTRGEQFFRHHGGKSVVIGRFLGPVRPVVPLIAGAFNMPWRRFLLFNIVSAIGWAPVYILPGFLVGSALAYQISLPPHLYAILGFTTAVLAALYWLIFRLQWGLDSGSRTYETVKSWMAQYDSTHWFWRTFSSTRPASGGEFPLGSLSLGVAAGVLFLTLASVSLSTHLHEGLDQQAKVFFVELRHPLFDPFALAMTSLGDIWPLVAGAALAIATFLFRGYYAAALHIALGLALTALMVTGLKEGFAIARPDLVAIKPASWSFPSGHATGITVFMALTASFVAREFHNRLRWRFYLLFSLPVLLVAISRMYLGVHWLSDVVGGILLGLSISGFIRASYSRYDQTPIHLDLVSLLAMLLWLALMVGYIVLHWPEAVRMYAAPVT